MAVFDATIHWERDTDDFTVDTFSRAHTWSFSGGATLGASSAPAYHGDPERINPEVAFVASLSSCHMLTFLAMAAYKQFVVDTYTDHAVGELARTPERVLAMTRVTLHPEVTFSGSRQPTPEELTALHEKAHEKCFIANSVKTEVVVEPVETVDA